MLLTKGLLTFFGRNVKNFLLFPPRRLREEVVTVYVTLGELLTLVGILIDTVALCVTVFALITRNSKKK